MAIKNRYEFLLYLSCVNANPNGDPDMNNLPRVDPDTMIGYMTDASIKRRIRDYIDLVHGNEPGMNIMVQSSVNLNRKIAEVKELAGVELSDKTKPAIEKSRLQACEKFYDVRTFGAVMSSGPNAGQVRGPVQVAFGQSLDPVKPMDIAVTRVASADNIKSAKTAAEYLAAEQSVDVDSLQMIGRKQFIPYGLYEIHGFISANLAEQTGFDEIDLKYLFEALVNMFDATRTASKGTMSVVSPLIIFKHVGLGAVQADKERSAKLGCAPAYKLFELVDCHKKSDVLVPTSHYDYECSIDLTNCPAGVEIGFMMSYGDGSITWRQLPADETWMTSV